MPGFQLFLRFFASFRVGLVTTSSIKVTMNCGCIIVIDLLPYIYD